MKRELLGRHSLMMENLPMELHSWRMEQMAHHRSKMGQKVLHS